MGLDGDCQQFIMELPWIKGHGRRRPCWLSLLLAAGCLARLRYCTHACKCTCTHARTHARTHSCGRFFGVDDNMGRAHAVVDCEASNRLPLRCGMMPCMLHAEDMLHTWDILVLHVFCMVCLMYASCMYAHTIHCMYVVCVLQACLRICCAHLTCISHGGFHYMVYYIFITWLMQDTPPASSDTKSAPLTKQISTSDKPVE